MLSDQQLQILFEALEYGLTISDSCTLANISRQTYYRHFNEDEEFQNRIAKAELKLKQDCLKYIKDKAPKNWFASAWLLERKFPEEFALKTKMEHSGEINAKLSILDFRKANEKIETADKKSENTK